MLGVAYENRVYRVCFFPISGCCILRVRQIYTSHQKREKQGTSGNEGRCTTEKMLLLKLILWRRTIPQTYTSLARSHRPRTKASLACNRPQMTTYPSLHAKWCYSLAAPSLGPAYLS